MQQLWLHKPMLLHKLKSAESHRKYKHMTTTRLPNCRRRYADRSSSAACGGIGADPDIRGTDLSRRFVLNLPPRSSYFPPSPSDHALCSLWVSGESTSVALPNLVSARERDHHRTWIGRTWIPKYSHRYHRKVKRIGEMLRWRTLDVLAVLVLTTLLPVGAWPTREDDQVRTPHACRSTL